jgi:hypothetical protein
MPNHFKFLSQNGELRMLNSTSIHRDITRLKITNDNKNKELMNKIKERYAYINNPLSYFR